MGGRRRRTRERRPVVDVVEVAEPGLYQPAHDLTIERLELMRLGADDVPMIVTVATEHQAGRHRPLAVSANPILDPLDDGPILGKGEWAMCGNEQWAAPNVHERGREAKEHTSAFLRANEQAAQRRHPHVGVVGIYRGGKRRRRRVAYPEHDEDGSTDDRYERQASDQSSATSA
jgi:hypothetical protein